MVAEPELIGLSILEGYKVRWSRETVARDLVQNFFDEVPDFDKVSIQVDRKARTVRIEGPSRFDHQYLRYLGATTKSVPERRSAGGFGEGFKVCALVLLRDYRVELVAGSGDWELRPCFRPMKLGRELCYELRREPAGPRDGEGPGSFVLLSGVDKRFCDVFDTVRDLFRHPKNPRLGRPIHVDDAAGIGVYQAHWPTMADLFYRRQHRGFLRFGRSAGLTFAFDDRLPELDADRDRRNFRAAGPLVAALAARLPDAVLTDLIHRLRVYWSSGNRVLDILVRQARKRGLKLTFPRRWLARDRGATHLQAHAERIGHHLGQAALATIGMPSVLERYEDAARPRLPDPLESYRLRLALQLYERLVGAPPRSRSLKVADVQVRGFSLREGDACIVPARHLLAPFRQNVGHVLAQLAIGRSYDRNNADRLTALLEGATRQAGELSAEESAWDDPPSLSGDDGTFGSLDDGHHSQITFSLLGPSGFPPFDALEQRLRDLAARRGLSRRVERIAVNGPRDAAGAYARGVPSVWVAGVEVDARKGSRVGYYLREFAGPDGPLPVPPDAMVDAILAELERKVRRSDAAQVDVEMDYLKRLYRADRSAAAYLLRTDPRRYEEKAVRSLIVKLAYESLREGERTSLDLLARTLSTAMVTGEVEALGLRSREPEPIRARLQLAFAAARERVNQLGALLERLVPGWNGEGSTDGMLLDAAVQLARRGSGVPLDLEVAALLVPPMATLTGRFDTCGLDESCARTCVQHSLDALRRALGMASGAEAAGQDLPTPDAVERALAEAMASFEAAVAVAKDRHDRADRGPLEGEDRDMICNHLDDHLPSQDPSDGADSRRQRADEARQAAAAAAVRAAYDQAVAAGQSEPLATRAAMAAALPFDDPGALVDEDA
jgi:hypothetical protein